MNLRQKLTEKFEESKCFIRFVIRHFIDDDCPYRASALAFTTLLAIIPMIAVGFAILSSLPIFQNLIGPIQNFIFANFAPSTGQVIQNYLQLLVMQASKLSSIGMLFLLFVALLVMYNIEAAMNKIWRVSSSRQGISAFLLYWAIVSLAPFLLALSIAASSYILSLPFIINHDIPALLNYLPILFSLMGFTFLYVVVPNRPVRFLHGFYGGIFASLLFESAKYGFAFYLTNYNIYQLLYGAFSTVPIFLVWIYWVWFITLLGAEISYAFSVHQKRRSSALLDGFSHALLWLYRLSLAQLEGKSLTLDELIKTSRQAYYIDVAEMLRQLTTLQLITITSEGHYVLSRDLNHITLYELSQQLPYRLPKASELYEATLIPGWQQQIQKLDNCLQASLMISIRELFQQ